MPELVAATDDEIEALRVEDRRERAGYAVGNVTYNEAIDRATAVARSASDTGAGQ